MLRLGRMRDSVCMRPSPLPPGLATPSFSVREAFDVGVTPRRLRAGDLSTPYKGIRTVAPPTTTEARCRAFLSGMGAGQFFSHSTAAILYQIPMPLRLQQGTDIHVSGREVRPRGIGVIGHRASDTPKSVARELPLTHSSFLLAELASILGYDDLIIAADGLVRRKYALATLDDLRRSAADHTGRHIRAVRFALGDARSGTDSAMETRLRLLIVRAGLPEPVIHHTIFDAAGDFVGTPDLSYVSHRIAIEYEGDHHRDDPRIFADDIERRERMQEAGWYVIRVISDHVFREPVGLAHRIRRVLAQRAP
jgi:hypothetical protein